MAIISKKKIPFSISKHLRKYLTARERAVEIPIKYTDLLRYNNSIPLYDNWGDDTLWETAFYAQDEMKDIYESLKEIYSILKADGDLSVMEHLTVDRVDICVFGNTQPFRIRIVNQVNDNFDYFYVKHADASRIYGLELEHILSPNRIGYIVDQDTLVEEHIAGIPGDQFIKHYMNDKRLNKIRLAKEFVKFNERSFVRLLGDMHSSNFVVVVTPDFEEVHYRIRAIDFDQQSFEGRKAIYMPQFFKQNNPLIDLGMSVMTPESMIQYQKEERSLIATRLKSSHHIINDLLGAMVLDKISLPKHVKSLRKDLAKAYKDKSFLKCQNMGQIVQKSLQTVLEKSHR